MVYVCYPDNFNLTLDVAMAEPNSGIVETIEKESSLLPELSRPR